MEASTLINPNGALLTAPIGIEIRSGPITPFKIQWLLTAPIGIEIRKNTTAGRALERLLTAPIGIEIW